MYQRKNAKGKLLFYSLFVIYVIVLCLIMFSLVFSICNAAPPDEVAVDLATATMAKGVEPTPNPSPFDCSTCKDTGWIIHGDGHQTKCPNCDLANALPGGFLDVVRQAKDLIRKGNELADRGKALLDVLRRDGKISIDIKIPIVTDGPESIVSQQLPSDEDCVDGKCDINSYHRTYAKPKPKSRWRWKR